MGDRLRGFCAALLPPEAGGPDPAHLAGLLERFLTTVPQPARAVLDTGFRAVDLYARRTQGASLSELEPDRREAVLARLTQTAQGALALDGLKTIVCLVAGADREAERMRRRALSADPVREDPPLDVTPSNWWPSRTRADVVVIGSGAGGAFCARTFARAGMDTVVLEEGRRFRLEEFRTRHPAQRFAELYRGAATTLALGTPPVALPIGRAVGGTTVVNSGTCYRTPDAVLQRWRDEHGFDAADPAQLARYFDDVEATLGVAPVPDVVMGRNGELALEGAKVLGWAAGPLRRNAPGCAGSCQCSIGCPRNAKAGVHLNALPQACDAGARIVERAWVERILHENGRATGVLVRRSGGSRFVIETERVVVACGATETPPLLRRSRLGRHRMLGRNLAVHPAIGIAGRFEEAVHATEGVLQSAAVEEFHESDGILVEATSAPPGMGSMMLPGAGRSLLAFLDGAPHLATLGAMIADRPRGRILGRKRPVLLYDLDRDDAAKLVKAASVMGKLLFAAGAQEVVLGWHRDPVVSTPEELEAACARVDTRTLHLAAFHPTGTAAAGADPRRHPVAPDGSLRGARGVYVADASILPTCPEVNPQISIMALACAISESIAT